MNQANNRLPIKKNIDLRKIITVIAAGPGMLLLSTLILIPIMLLTGSILTGEVNITAAVLTTVVAELIIIIWALAVTDQLKGWREALYLKGFKLKNVGIGIGAGIALFITLQLVSIALTKLGILTIESSETSSSLGALEGIELYIVLLLIVPILVPIVEEVFFRGFIFGFLRKNAIIKPKYSLWTATLVSSIIFALMHFQGAGSLNDLFVIIWIFIVALVNVMLLEKTQSLYTSIASHVTYNMITAILSIVASQVA